MATETKETKAPAPALTGPALEQALAAFMALASGDLPKVRWCEGDDLCDCTFQRIGEWTNPYLARTLRVRLCCIWKEIYKQYPQHVQEIPAYWSQDLHRWETKPQAWNSPKADMPKGLWYRALAAKEGKPLAAIREQYKDRLHERPKRMPKASFSISPVKQATPEQLERSLRKRLVDGGWLLNENDPLPA